MIIFSIGQSAENKRRRWWATDREENEKSANEKHTVERKMDREGWGEQRCSLTRVIPLSSANPVVARQPKIWIGRGPSCERAHHLWMSYDTNCRHTLTQTHMVWLSFGKATVTIWHLNTRQINWLRYLQCVRVCACAHLCSNSNNMCNDRPNPTPFTQDSIQGLQCIPPGCAVCVCDSFTPKCQTRITCKLESNLIFLHVFSASSPNSVIIFNINFQFRFTATTTKNSSSSYFKELSGGVGRALIVSVERMGGVRWDALIWQVTQEPHLNFVAFLLCKWKRERSTI